MEEIRNLLARQNDLFAALTDRVNNMHVNVPASQPVPQPPPLCLEGDMSENFDFFERNWNNYASAIGMNNWPADQNAKKVGFLLSVIGFDALRKYFNFELTDQQRQSPVAALAAIKAKVVRARNMNLDLLEFLSVKQESESIDEFLTKLRVLAKPCQLGVLEERLLAYKVITANKWPHLRKRLITCGDITLAKAVDECRLEEVSVPRLMALEAEREKEVNYIRPRRENNEKKYCKFCGGRHIFEKGVCPALGQKCRKCKAKNHFEKMCPTNKGAIKKRKVKQVLNNSDESDDSESIVYSESEESGEERQIGKIYNNASKGGHVLADLQLKVDGRWEKVICELDTGANTSLIGYNCLRKLLGKKDPELLPSEFKLQSFGGNPIPVLGEVKLPCRHNGQRVTLVLQVVDVDHRPLLSANVCDVLGLVKFCNTVAYKRPEKATVPSDVWKIHRIEANRIVDEYSDVFDGYGSIEGEVILEVDPDVPPLIQQPRRIPIALRGKLKMELDNLEKNGIIVKEHQHTKWVSNILLVNRTSSGESFRICLDPIPLNKALKRPNLQFLTLDEVLPELSNAKVFSTVDAKKGFWQVVLDEASSKLTTFWTPFGRYRWTRLPFGISSAPEIFQMKMREVLDGLEGVECLADDVLIYGRGETLEEAMNDHNRCLKQLFERLKQHNVKLNRSKLNLCQPSVKFFGHLLTDRGLQADNSKLSVIRNYPPPTDKKELHRFIGMLNYLSRFIPNLSSNLHVLRKMLNEKVPWSWNAECQQEFDKAKSLVSDIGNLQYYNMNKPLWIECDASSHGLGVAVYQDTGVVGYASRVLTPTERNYAQIEKELLAVLFACVHFDQLIIGNAKTVVKTDHKPLINIMKKPLLKAPKRLQHMLLNLQRYNIQLQFVSGKENVLADAISRAPEDHKEGTSEFHKLHIYRVFGEVEQIDLSSFLSISDDRINDILENTAEDSVLQTVILYTKEGWPTRISEVPDPVKLFFKHRHEISCRDGLVFRGDRVVIPTAIRRKLIEKLHVGHPGIEASLRLARSNIFWPGMNDQIKNRIQECGTCAKFGASQRKPPMKSHPIPVYPFQLVSMDVFFQVYQGKQRIFLVTVDHYSDYFEIDILKDLSSSSVIQACKRNFACHGTPQMIITDNGTNFVNEEMVKFSKSWDFKHSTSAPYHQQANGKAEAAVKIAKHLITKTTEDGQDLWLALQLWRNTPNNIGSSPASRLFSRGTRCGIPMPAANLVPNIVEDVPEAILKNRQRIKYNYDKRTRRLPEIDIGSPVYVQLRPETSKQWTPGIVHNKLGDRSYLVEVGGTSYRRDCVNVKPRKEPAAPLATPRDWLPTLLPTTSAPPGSAPETVPESIPSVIQTEGTSATSVAVESQDSGGPQPLVSSSTASTAVRSESPQLDRPRRQSKIPSKFKDFVVTMK